MNQISNRGAWGRAQGQKPQRRLGLQRRPYDFVMSYEVDYIDDLRVIAEEMKPLGFVDPMDVIETIEVRQVHVKLPKGLVLVGMVPVGSDSPETYGIVDFSAFRPT
ncbi:MAG: hypothetical protein IPG66_17725 [Hydrogenophilales bacterium]|nr:hypothetical protein [Hydrogenophilales bacterium]